MEQGTPSFAELYPVGYPAALVAGRVVSLRFFIPGEPVPQSRPRARVQTPPGKRPYAQIYEEKDSREYKEHVAQHAAYQVRKCPVEPAGEDFEIPLRGVKVIALLTFNMHRPVSYPSRITEHTKRPDVDNLAKGVLDGIVQGGVLHDDGCITEMTVRKRYADESPGALPGMAGPPLGVEVELTAIPVEVLD